MVLDLLTGASMSTGSQGKSTSWWESHYFPSDIKVGSPVVHVLSSWGYSDGRPPSSHATLRLSFSPFLPPRRLSRPLHFFVVCFLSLPLFVASPLPFLLYRYHCLLSFAPRSRCSSSAFIVHLISSLSLESDATEDRFYFRLIHHSVLSLSWDLIQDTHLNRQIPPWFRIL